LHAVTPPAPDLQFLTDGGHMGARMRGHDWSGSPLGPPEAWPQALRASVSLMLGSAQPMFIAWGPELGFLYNDSYAEILGAKHPGVLGRPFPEVWREIWADIGPLVDRTLAGERIWQDELHLVLERHGYPEDTWFSSPTAGPDETASVACAEQRLRRRRSRPGRL
jgi:PAS domain-containing protein